jgi:Flp pilus assembly protein TadD
MTDVGHELSRVLEWGEEGDWDGMLARLSELLDESPEDPMILCWLGVAEHEVGLDSSAYERFRACLSLEPTDPWILATVGTGLARFDDPDAEAALRAAAVTAPDLPFARAMYGAYLAREGMSSEALDHLEAAAALAPDDGEVFSELGAALGLAGRNEESAEAYFRAWELRQDDGWSRAMAGMATLEGGRIEEALGDLQVASGLRPDDVELALLLALAAGACDRPDIALNALERARMNADADERPDVEAVGDRLDDGPKACRLFLAEEYAPGVYRRRLMIRP